MSTVALNGTVNGTTTGAATPLYRYSRKTQFTARLIANLSPGAIFGLAPEKLTPVRHQRL